MVYSYSISIRKERVSMDDTIRDVNDTGFIMLSEEREAMDTNSIDREDKR
jgi:hypothetical protein